MEAPTSADFCSYLAYIPIYPGAEAFHHHGGSYPQQLNQALPTGDSEANVHLSVSHVSSTLKICFLKSCRVRHVFFFWFQRKASSDFEIEMWDLTSPRRIYKA